MLERPRRSPPFFTVTEGAGGDIAWHPRADVYQTREGWLVKLELAGVQAEDVDIRAHGSHLTISGTRRDRLAGEGWSCYAMEIAYSRFERSFSLPCNLEASRIAVKGTEGMLLVHIMTEGTHT
jgi:HSP20 family protein